MYVLLKTKKSSYLQTNFQYKNKVSRRRLLFDKFQTRFGLQ